MKKSIFIIALMAATLNIQAIGGKQPVAPVEEPMPTWTEWHDQQVNEVNRFKLHTNFFAYENETLAMQGDRKKSANFLSLHGPWK
ncbi:MAG: hypothetical protein LIR46_03195, partial [Bacteroidota bacterium]|nr:hypothetical protein [Bacteroidota bacterium]